MARSRKCPRPSDRRHRHHRHRGFRIHRAAVLACDQQILAVSVVRVALLRRGRPPVPRARTRVLAALLVGFTLLGLGVVRQQSGYSACLRHAVDRTTGGTACPLTCAGSRSSHCFATTSKRAVCQASSRVSPDPPPRWNLPFLVPDVRGLDFFAAGPRQAEVDRWWARHVPPSSVPVYLLSHRGADLPTGCAAWTVFRWWPQPLRTPRCTPRGHSSTQNPRRLRWPSPRLPSSGSAFPRTHRSLRWRTSSAVATRAWLRACGSTAA